MNPERLPDLYTILDDKPRLGRPVKIAKGSKESHTLKELALQDEEHWQMPWYEIAKEANINCSRSTIDKVMLEHHSLGRYRRRHKPNITEGHKADRTRLAEWVLQIPAR